MNADGLDCSNRLGCSRFFKTSWDNFLVALEDFANQFAGRYFNFFGLRITDSRPP